VTLGVVITACAEPDLPSTLASLHATAPNIPVVVVNDGGRSPIGDNPWIKQIRTEQLVGVGPARTIGVEACETDYVLTIDAHMRFTSNWYASAIAFLEKHPTAVHCAACLGLDAKHPSVDAPNAVYHGATINFYGPDRQVRGKTQVWEAVWAKEQPGDDYELAAPLGASYFVPREWFLRTQPLRYLHRWGCDEIQLGLKAWLSGIEVRMMKPVRIGHRWRSGKILPFRLSPADILYNKLFGILTILPKEYQSRILPKFKRDGAFNIAMRIIKEDWHLIEQERVLNRRLFVREFQWILDRFQLPFP